MPRPRRFLRRTVTAFLALALAGLALLLFLQLKRELPPPDTIAGWRAAVTSVAGDGAPGVRDAAVALQAGFSEPYGLAADGEGNLYVADAGDSNRIRVITKEGTVTTLAGGVEGYADGAGAAASFNTPSAVALDTEGNLYVADTGNNRIRKVTKQGVVTTLAGDGTAGYRDGAAEQAQFNAPVGLAVDRDGIVYVADTYNDRIRIITKDGMVRTIAGTGVVGYADGDALGSAQLDTPCGVAVNEAGEVFIADTGNNRIRRLTKEGLLTTLSLINEDQPPANEAARPSEQPKSNEQARPNEQPKPIEQVRPNEQPKPIEQPKPNEQPKPMETSRPAELSAPVGEISRPVGLALTHDGFLYVTQLDRGRVVQITPDLRVRRIAGSGSGFGDGDGASEARFNQPAGLALDRKGALYVADSANHLVRKISHAQEGRETARPFDGQTLPRLTAEHAGAATVPWPFDPQDGRHEVVATLGEVRGNYDTDDSRHHLHSGIDVFGPFGKIVRAVRDEKVSGPLSNWGFGGANEGMRVRFFSYIHQHVGRDEKGEMLKGTPFVAVRDEAGKVVRVRVKRGTRLRVGDALGTVNRMYHVHLNYGPPGAEVNPLFLSFPNFSDTVAPTIERDGIQLFGEAGGRLTLKRNGRLVVPRTRLRIVVDAYDQNDGNLARRRLGLYRLGFQILRADGEPIEGYEQPRIQIEFDRLPPDREATKIAYADESGITVYGSRRTRFLYELTNTVRAGRAERGDWDATLLSPGDYVLRVLASDLAGNVAASDRDLAITIE